jgi:integrase/recombinase XerD
MRRFIVEVKGQSYLEESTNYHKHLLTLGHSNHGARTKYHYLLKFFAWLESQGIHEIKQIQTKQLSDFYKQQTQRPNKITGEPLSLKTLHHHMRAIQLFFAKQQAEGTIKINPASTIKFPYPKQNDQPTREILSQEEIKELYRFAVNHQEKAILSLAYGCGLRVGELVNCNMADIKFSQRIIIVPKGKGNKRRVVPLSSGVISDLSNYFFKERQKLTNGRDYKKNEQAFMLHSRGGRMQKGTYNKRLRQLIIRTGNEAIEQKQITIHNLRHSIATHLLEQGIPVEQVREFLGHSQLETTQIYTHINRKHLQNLKREGWS